MISEDYLLDLKTQMIRDYRESFPLVSSDKYPNAKEIRDRMSDDFEKSIEFVVGQKYIKVICKNSVALFIVNTNNDKQFCLGDMLKAASFSAPARNFSRGSVFDSADRTKVRWTGV